MDVVALIFGILLGFLVGFFLVRLLSISEHRAIKTQAVRSSKNSIMGEVYEKVLPALPNFPFAPKDMVFLGQGCDYIIFDGLSRGALREVVFLELKSGKSQLNANERAIKSAIDQGRVRFTEYRIGSVK